jgi:hypothetical protein
MAIYNSELDGAIRKPYSAPRLSELGDMTQNTLGASGPGNDSAGLQSNANGSQKSSTNRRNEGKTFDRSVFDNSIFDRK